MTDSDKSQDEPALQPPAHLAGLTGMDLVRRTLAEAREAARSQGKDVGQGRRAPLRRRTPGAGGGRRSWSGPGPDRRDPQSFGAATRDLAQSRGWSAQVAEGTVLGQWRSVVGDDIASHATPTRLSDGVLSVAAESTAWATQLRLVRPSCWPRSPPPSVTAWSRRSRSPVRRPRPGAKGRYTSPVGVRATPTAEPPPESGGCVALRAKSLRPPAGHEANRDIDATAQSGRQKHPKKILAVGTPR